MVEPGTMAAIAAAVTVLANEYLKGTASEAGKATWNKIKSLLRWDSDPALPEVSQKVISGLDTNEKAQKLIELLKLSGSDAVTTLVGCINADKVVVVQTLVTKKFEM